MTLGNGIGDGDGDGDDLGTGRGAGGRIGFSKRRFPSLNIPEVIS